MQTKRGNTIGIVGIGDMGFPIAHRLLEAGRRLMVHDLRPQPLYEVQASGAHVATTIEELAAGAATVLIVVTSDEQVINVSTALFATPDRPLDIVILSTILPSTVEGLASTGLERGVTVIDAAMTGGNEKARRGLLTLFVGGSQECVDRHASLLRDISVTAFHLGPAGSGSTVKLVNNAISLGSYVIQMEAMKLATSHGLTEDVVASVLAFGTADSRGLRTWGRFDRFVKTHTLAVEGRAHEQMSKDLKLAVSAGASKHLDLGLIERAAELMPRRLAERADDVHDAGLEQLCKVCGQELISPFTGAGVHPECLSMPEPPKAIVI